MSTVMRYCIVVDQHDGAPHQWQAVHGPYDTAEQAHDAAAALRQQLKVQGYRETYVTPLQMVVPQ